MAILKETTINGDLEVKGELSGNFNSWILNHIYPVGSIFISTNSTNPHDYLGGTWNYTDFADRYIFCGYSTIAPGTTGGDTDAKMIDHKHTISETAHSHTINGTHNHTIYTNATSGNQGGIEYSSKAAATDRSTSSNPYFAGQYCEGPVNSSGTTTWVGHTITSYGSNASGKNMPPFYAAYVWVRTA